MNQAEDRAAGARIPRIFHRIWIGGPMPDDYVAYGRTWEAAHPGWELRTWDEASLPALVNQRSFDEAPTLAQKVDIARYEIVLRFGGVYLDCDFECLRNIEPLLEGVDAFSASEDGRLVSIGIMGAVAGHPLFARVVEDIPGSIAALPGRPPNEQTGPELMTRVVAAHRAAGGPPVTVFPPDVFYPYLWTEPHRKGERFPDAYAVHHWAASWKQVPVVAAPERPRRVLVAVDPAAPGAAGTVVSAFLDHFGAGDPVELAFCIPPTTGDAGDALAAMLLDLGADPADVPAVVLYDPAELASLELDVAFVPSTAAPATDAADAAVAGIRAVATALRSGAPVPGRDASASAAVAEAATAWAARGARRRRPLRPVAPLPEPAGVHGTYIGGGRVLARTRFGAKLLLSSDDLSIMPELVADGVYDLPLTNYLRSRLAPGDVVVDVGANVGLFTVLMAQLVGPTGRVLAYEADPDNYELLRDNVALNYLTDRVTTLERAASSSAGTAQFSRTARFKGNGSLNLQRGAYEDRYPVDRVDAITVATEPLDARLPELGHVDLVKIDVEGGELRVLEGMGRMLAEDAVDTVVVEILRPLMGEDWEPMAALLRRLGDAGMRFATPGDDGRLRTLPLEELLAVGWYPQVVIERDPDRAQAPVAVPGRSDASELSVVLCTYDRRDQVLGCLSALRGQTVPRGTFEVVVVDDGSTDGTANALSALHGEDLPFRLRVVHRPNGGLAAARNSGLEVAAGRICLLLDDDVTAEPDLVARHLDAHRRLGGVRAAVLGTLEAPPGTTATALAHHLATSDLVFPYAGMRPHGAHDWTRFWTGNVSVDTAALRAAGGFDESFRDYGCEDTDMGIRLGRLGFAVHYDPQARARHHHPLDVDGLARRQRAVAAAHVRLFAKHPDALDHPDWRWMGALTVEACDRLVAQHRGPVAAQEQRARGLADVALGTEDDAGVLAALASALQVCNRAWWIEGIAEGLRRLGRDGVADPEPVGAGARR